MNIAREINFSSEKPQVLPIHKTEASNFFAVGLTKDQVLAKHKTHWPTLLIVLKGSIVFRINSEKLVFSALDTYQIPLDTDHDVTGLEAENIFLIMKVKEAETC